MRWMFLASIIFLFPLVSSISTTMLSNYQPTETMIIEIQGNILEPINPQDILFKRAHVAVALNYDIKRIGDKYYLYAQLPLTPNNYTLFINDISTMVNGAVTEIDYNQTFEVVGNVSDYSINPGFIISDRDFSLTLTSNLDHPTNLDVDFPLRSSFTIQPGTNTIQFSIDSISQGAHLAKIGKYTVPIQITRNIFSNWSNEIILNIYPSMIAQTILINQKKVYNFSIMNAGSTAADNLYFSFDEGLFEISPSVIKSIEPNQSQLFNLTLKKTNSTQLFARIFVASGDINRANLTINLLFTSNESQITNESIENQYYCSELGGKFCSATETCSNEIISSLDGLCCPGICKSDEGSSNSWIVYVLISVVLIILIIVYLRYKKSKNPLINRASPLNLSLSNRKSP